MKLYDHVSALKDLASACLGEISKFTDPFEYDDVRILVEKLLSTKEYSIYNWADIAQEFTTQIFRMCHDFNELLIQLDRVRSTQLLNYPEAIKTVHIIRKNFSHFLYIKRYLDNNS